MNDSPREARPDTPQSGSFPPDSSQQSTRKNRQRLWATVGVGLLLVLAAGGLGFFVIAKQSSALQQSSPASTMQTYCDASRKMDAHELYSTFSSSFKAQPRNGEANFQFGFGMMKSLGSTFTNCTVSTIQQYGSTATATVILTSQSAQSQSTTSIQTVSLIVENGVWKVNDIEGS